MSAASSIPGRRNAAQLAAAALGIAVLAAATWHGATGLGTAQDAVYIVRDNPLLGPEVSLFEVFRSPYWDPQLEIANGLYRPLAVASFRATRALLADPLPVDHALDVGLHATCAILTLLFLVRMRVPVGAAFGGAALFAVHPVHSEVVLSLVGRCDLLATGFALLALLALLGPDAATRRERILRGSAAGLCFLLSLLSKESAVALVAIAPLCVYARARWQRVQAARSLREAGACLPFLLAALGLVLLLRAVVLGGLVVEPSEAVTAGAGGDRFDALALLTFFGQKLLWPSPLLPDYASGLIEPGSLATSARTVLGGVAVAGFAAAAATLVRVRRQPGNVALPVVLFGLALLPVSNLVIPIGTQFGERLLYLPSIFALLLCTLALTPASPRRRRAAACALGFAVGLGATASAARVPAWASNRTLFEAAALDAPGNYHAQMGYGTTLLSSAVPADRRRAREAFETAARIEPRLSAPHAALGKLALEVNELEEARGHFEAALERALPRERHLAALNLARSCRRLGEAACAERHLLAVIEEQPDFVPARRELGDEWSTRGRVLEALAHYEAALARAGGDVSLWQRVIWAELHLGKTGAAARRLAASPTGTRSASFLARLEREGLSLP